MAGPKIRTIAIGDRTRDRLGVTPRRSDDAAPRARDALDALLGGA